MSPKDYRTNKITIISIVAGVFWSNVKLLNYFSGVSKYFQ